MKGHTGVLKRRVKNKDVILQGCVMDSRTGTVVEMYHDIGFDAILLDREHAGFDIETQVEQIRLARALDMPCMVRVAEPTYGELNRIMDQAPDGIYVPRIRSRAEVESILRMIRFPPNGVKGLGASTCPAGKYVGWNPDPTAQVDYYNTHFVFGIQIETAEAFASLDDILSVPGIDIAVVGNDDLSLGLGLLGKQDATEYVDAVRRIIATCNKYGVLPGIAGGDPKRIRRWKDEGMRVFWCAADVVSMWLFTQQAYDDITAELAK